MIEFLSSWAKGLGLAIVVVSILEMLLPNNKIKKYVRVIMGIYILFNIISPLVENKDLLDVNSIDPSQYTNQSTTNSTEEVNQTSMDERIAQLYKEEIEKDITKKIEEQGYEVSKCKVSVNLKEKNEESKITKIEIDVKKSNDTKNNQNKNEENAEETLVKEIQKIRKVDISNSEDKNNDNSHNNENINKTDISNIKKFLIEEYEVNEKCLEIN